MLFAIWFSSGPARSSRCTSTTAPALVIGRTARRVAPEEGWSYVGGVTAANDFGVYDLRYADRGSNLRAKGGDGFTPLGPVVLPAAGLDPAALRLRTWVNGELVQEDSSGELLFGFGRLVADLSQLITLEPGDVVLTGTPAGASVVVPGYVVEVEVDAGGQTTGRLVTTIAGGTVPLGPYGALPRVDENWTRPAATARGCTTSRSPRTSGTRSCTSATTSARCGSPG
ncbi:fumarylacetoacetate hydrolase family protein [Amycolatopsis sp. NPDC051716]|uniref:fumarylacetoacetate hydrolase family protein n=1 Tax=Amycolatopsis sp. NPDC051716 TaxID=3155804 RepID=UPI003445BA33